MTQRLPTPEPPDSPIVADVRAVRDDIWKEAGGDIEKVLADLAAMEQKARAAGRKFVPPPDLTTRRAG